MKVLGHLIWKKKRFENRFMHFWRITKVYNFTSFVSTLVRQNGVEKWCNSRYSDGVSFNLIFSWNHFHEKFRENDFTKCFQNLLYMYYVTDFRSLSNRFWMSCFRTKFFFIFHLHYLLSPLKNYQKMKKKIPCGSIYSFLNSDFWYFRLHH